MSAFARLLLTYFTGTPVARWTSGVTAVVLVPIAAMTFYRPEVVSGPYEQGLPAPGVVAVFIGICIAFAGAFLASAPLPVIVWRLVAGHRAHLLPRAHGKLLASALATAALVSVPGALLTMGAYSFIPGAPLGSIFVKALTTLFFTFTLLYAVLWLIAERTSPFALWVGSLLLIGGLAVPSFYISNPRVPVWGAAAASAVLWTLLAAALRHAPRILARIATLSRVGRADGHAPRRPERGGDVQMLVGIARPWSIAAGQTVLMLLATLFISAPSVWLFFLTLFSAVSGATASLAPAQSRALWLPAGWSRPQLFRRVEAAYWRQNGYALAVLLPLYLAGAWYLDLPPATVGVGLPLLMLAMAVSTYLGLMMTRGVGWLETALGVATMLLLMSAAVYGARVPLPTDLVAALGLLLASLTLVFRFTARRRWTGLDWLVCRREFAARPPA